ncbi:MAG: hypothetical protein H7066_03345 [Cytophagaceae bacterium]|nr:hypothetical protein [Gemmatimonadaceae bacterium]
MPLEARGHDVPRRGVRPRLVLLLLMLGLTATSSFVGCSDAPLIDAGPMGPYLEPGDMQQLDAQGAHLLDVLQSYRREHGRFPATFAEAGLQPMDTGTRFGPWRWRIPTDMSTYVLEVGDYGRSQFTIHWSERTQAWSLDM